MFVAAPVSLPPAMPFRLSIPLLLAAVLGLTQCQENNGYPVYPMPDATQTGANTAGCVVDGHRWVASDYNTSIGVPHSGPVGAHWLNHTFGGPNLQVLMKKTVADESDVHNDTAIVLTVAGADRPGTYVLDQAPAPGGSTPTSAASFTYTQKRTVEPFLTGPGFTGRMVVTRLDTVARIVSGTFEFTARQAGPGATVRVTDGRFDTTF